MYGTSPVKNADRKLRLDLRHTYELNVGRMAPTHNLDDETRALIEQLCSRAGMLMEDASVEAIVRAPSLNGLRLKVERSRSAVRQMHQLLGAADTLLKSI